MGGRFQKEKAMQCVMCTQGETEPGTTTMTLERDTTTVVFKYVPAEVCQVCGEAYLDAETTRHLLHIVEEAVHAGVLVQVRSYAV
jgi:YgiT-type zinc finger domain-containing protein